MKANFDQTLRMPLVKLATIGAIAIAMSQGLAFAGPINPVFTPSQLGKIKKAPAWTISGEMQVQLGRYANLTENPTCAQFTVQAVSTDQIKDPNADPNSPFTSDVPKFTYPTKAVKMGDLGSEPFTKTLKCKYSISGSQYTGELVKLRIGGPYAELSYPDLIIIVPALLEQTKVDLTVGASNIG